MKEYTEFAIPPVILSSYAVAGEKEGSGPLGKYYDEVEKDSYFSKKSWELAEGEMQRRAISGAISKSAFDERDIDCVIAGDLQNQCIASSMGAAGFGIPYIGVYGACSTFGETLILGSSMICGGMADNVLCSVSSHFCTAERQFRFPLPYGSMRQPVAQRTVTGAGALLLSKEGVGVKIKGVMTGKITDYGITDANNMGAAMAPAAADTLTRFFNTTGTTCADYDVIATGDLASEGYELLIKLMEKNGIRMADNYTDCGLMVYNNEEQDVHAGASGAGCSAIVTAGYFIKKLSAGEIRRMLIVPTGALISAQSLAQGCTIPAVAHLICLESGDNK